MAKFFGKMKEKVTVIYHVNISKKSQKDSNFLLDKNKMKKELGLKQKEVNKLIAENGYNEIETKKISGFLKFIRWFVSPIALMLLAAAILSLFIDKIFDFYFILFLMLLNFSIGFWQEKKADNAIEKLSQKLAVKVKIFRDGKWRLVESRLIVLGDVIELGSGDIVPADVEILESKNLSINEAALTGESLPKEKNQGEKCFSGSFVVLGWARCRVVATGKNTYFGKILISIDQTVRRSLLEKDILNISKWLSFLSLAAVAILSVVFYFKQKPLGEIITLDLGLIIAGIPISLPTVMTIIISFGVLDLAKKKTIVRRLSALEDIANVNLLLSDKTGTLTKNEIVVEKIITYGQFSSEQALRWAYFTTQENDRNPINLAVRRKISELKLEKEFKILDFIPFDSVRKRSTAEVLADGQELRIRAGASQVIEPFCVLDEKTKQKFQQDIAYSAQKGYRTVALAIKNHTAGEKKMSLVGLLLFSDSLDKGTKSTLDFIKKSGIKIKMLSGDNQAIVGRIASQLGIEGEVKNREMIEGSLANLPTEDFEKTGAFAEIFPADKYDLVQLAQQRYLVAVTGDGINDLPALKAANVGIAVKNAVDALKSAADLVLVGSGISIIRDAIIESRKIFTRLYTYSIYRMSESFRIIIAILFLGIFYGIYPLTPIQLILLALLNDIPIISLAFNRVKIATKPAHIDAKKRFKESAMFGLVGTLNSFLLVILARNLWHLDWSFIQTLFFLKLTVSGHLLIYVVHTKKHWWRFLPSREVIWATAATQIVASLFAFFGLFMQPISLGWIIFIWLWALVWMQILDFLKRPQK